MMMKNNEKKRTDRLKNFILNWNLNFPIDRWWRNKHKVAFNSPRHREVSFLDQYYEWLEDKLYKDLYEKDKHKNDYKPNNGDFINLPDVSDLDIETLKKEAMNKLKQFKK